MLTSKLLKCNRTHALLQLQGSSNIKRFLSTQKEKYYDIVIAGGGMVGTTLACTLASKDKQWTLPEKYSNRVVSINPGTYKLFNDIGAWNFIEKSRFATIKDYRLKKKLKTNILILNHELHKFLNTMLISKLLKVNRTHVLLQLQGSSHIKRFLSTQKEKHYDIVITGGGMVGTTLACTLGKNKKLNQKNILLLEASKERQWTLPEKYSNRVVSINPGTYKLFNDIGAWNFIEKSRFATVKRLQVWDALSDASITFGNSELTDTVSYIVENDVLLAAVREEAKKCSNVNVLYDAKVECYDLPDYHGNLVTIKLANGDEYTCDLLLGCDGVNSSVRKAMQVEYLSWSYHQMGVVATLKLCDEIKNEIAWQRFLPAGPIALLPLTGSLSSLVWSTSPQEAKRLLGLSDEEFVDEVNRAVWSNYNRSPTVQQISSAFDSLLRVLNCSMDEVRQYPPKIEAIEEKSRAAFPLGFGHSSCYIGKGVALVGDAAHRIHPLAGQGVNLGFGDVTCLNKVLSNAVYSGSTITDLNYLKDYESERQKHNVPTMLAVEGLHRLYNTDFTPLVLLRSLGLQATNAMEPLKRAIISQAAV